MTSDPEDAGTAGVLRIAPDQLPRNHHGDQVAPLTPTGTPYQLRWIDHDHGGLTKISPHLKSVRDPVNGISADSDLLYRAGY